MDNRYKILTKDGFKNFKGLKRSTHNNYIKLHFNDGTSFTCSEDHLVLKDNNYINVLSLKELDTISDKTITKVQHIKNNKPEVFYDIVEVQDNNSYICSGIDSHNCDECAFIKPSLFEEYMDSVMPAMAAIQGSQAIFSSTANGLNHWYHMVQGALKKAREKAKADDTIILDDGTEITVDEYYKRIK
jgi:hypothetical protein